MPAMKEFLHPQDMYFELLFLKHSLSNYDVLLGGICLRYEEIFFSQCCDGDFLKSLLYFNSTQPSSPNYHYDNTNSTNDILNSITEEELTIEDDYSSYPYNYNSYSTYQGSKLLASLTIFALSAHYIDQNIIKLGITTLAISELGSLASNLGNGFVSSVGEFIHKNAVKLFSTIYSCAISEQLLTLTQWEKKNNVEFSRIKILSSIISPALSSSYSFIESKVDEYLKHCLEQARSPINTDQSFTNQKQASFIQNEKPNTRNGSEASLKEELKCFTPKPLTDSYEKLGSKLAEHSFQRSDINHHTVQNNKNIDVLDEIQADLGYQFGFNIKNVLGRSLKEEIKYHTDSSLTSELGTNILRKYVYGEEIGLEEGVVISCSAIAKVISKNIAKCLQMSSPSVAVIGVASSNIVNAILEHYFKS